MTTFRVDRAGRLRWVGQKVEEMENGSDEIPRGNSNVLFYWFFQKALLEIELCRMMGFAGRNKRLELSMRNIIVNLTVLNTQARRSKVKLRS